MRKKLYTQAYFLINSSHSYEHSFGVRLKYVGLNSMIIGYSFARLYFSSLRLKAGENEAFN
jgi:hypothetical protein